MAATRRPGGMLLWGLVLLVTACGAPAADSAPSPGADAVGWPLTLRYTVTVTAPGAEVAGRSVHAFTARSWDDWADLVVSSQGEAAVGQASAVQRYRDGALVAGMLRTGPPEGAALATALQDVVGQFPGNVLVAVDERGERTVPPARAAGASPSPLPVTPEEDLAGRRSPNTVFNPGLAGDWGAVPDVTPASAGDLAERADLTVAAPAEVAARLGIAPGAVARTAWTTGTCAVTCEAWVSTGLPALEVPLEVDWILGDGWRYQLVVDELLPAVTALD